MTTWGIITEALAAEMCAAVKEILNLDSSVKIKVSEIPALIENL